MLKKSFEIVVLYALLYNGIEANTYQYTYDTVWWERARIPLVPTSFHD